MGDWRALRTVDSFEEIDACRPGREGEKDTGDTEREIRVQESRSPLKMAD